MSVDNTFIALKYQLPTADNFLYGPYEKCQELLNTYPKEVVSNWSWRCAEDVEHLATTSEVKEVYRVARLVRDGKATKEELNKADVATYAAAYNACAYHASAYAAYASAYTAFAAA